MDLARPRQAAHTYIPSFWAIFGAAWCCLAVWMLFSGPYGGDSLALELVAY
jgi:hypothetical protein